MSKINLDLYEYKNLTEMEKRIADDEIDYDCKYYMERDVEIAAFFGSKKALEFFSKNNITSPLINIFLDNYNYFDFDYEPYVNFCTTKLLSENNKIAVLEKINKDKYPNISISFDVLSHYFTEHNRAKKEMFDVIHSKYSWESWENFLSGYKLYDAIFKNRKLLNLLEYFAGEGHRIHVSSFLMSQIYRKSLYDIFDYDFLDFPSSFFTFGVMDDVFYSLAIDKGILPIRRRC
jgi:hypothetical protein